jgi:hypothetical protein
MFQCSYWPTDCYAQRLSDKGQISLCEGLGLMSLRKDFTMNDLHFFKAILKDEVSQNHNQHLDDVAKGCVSHEV